MGINPSSDRRTPTSRIVLANAHKLPIRAKSTNTDIGDLMQSQFETKVAVDRDNPEITSNPLTRNGALKLYIQLQRLGCLPYMFEDSGGSYRVCYNAGGNMAPALVG